MRIPCPYCGPRGNEEFVFLGGVGPHRPDNDDADAWHDYVYLRDNVAGVHREYWQHAHGCRAWLIVTRDTRSHVVLGAEVAEIRG
jgi:heterotetrameric sarcosine oxidase delta subunit